jgi:dienelactone hydrolase
MRTDQLLADDFARHGFYTVVPQLFQECVPTSAFEPGSNFDIGAWFGRNGIDYSEPRARQVLAALKESGFTKIGVTGYCYGARSGFNLAFENAISALAVSHPSLLKIPDDIEVRALCFGCYACKL